MQAVKPWEMQLVCVLEPRARGRLVFRQLDSFLAVKKSVYENVPTEPRVFQELHDIWDRTRRMTGHKHSHASCQTLGDAVGATESCAPCAIAPEQRGFAIEIVSQSMSPSDCWLKAMNKVHFLLRE